MLAGAPRKAYISMVFSLASLIRGLQVQVLPGLPETIQLTLFQASASIFNNPSANPALTDFQTGHIMRSTVPGLSLLVTTLR